MANQKERVCKQCKFICNDDICPNCNSKEIVDNFKGRIIVLDVDQSEIAKNLKFTKKGNFAIKLG